MQQLILPVFFVKLNKETIIKTITQANQIYETDFKLVGSWDNKSHSDHDIDLITDLDIKEFLVSATYIVKQTGMVVDVFPSWAERHGLMKNYIVCPDGKHGFAFDIEMDTLILEGLVDLHCSNCGFSWSAKGETEVPKTCPKCQKNRGGL